MATIGEQVEAKLNELDDEKAAEYFGVSVQKIKAVRKNHKIPLAWADKVLEENQDKNKTETQPDPNPGENSKPNPVFLTGPFRELEALAKNANVGVQQIVKDFNEKISPEINKAIQELAIVKSAQFGLEKKLEALMQVRPQSTSTAPTLGQLVQSEGRVISNSQQFERDPGVSHTRPQAQTLATFTETTGGNGQQVSQHPLDTGIAPTAEQVREQDAIRAAGGDPALIGTNKPAGPATQPAQANYNNWTQPLRSR